jgi:hypothetical protein
MHRMIVHDKKYLALALTYQTAEKFKENLGDEPALIGSSGFGSAVI